MWNIPNLIWITAFFGKIVMMEKSSHYESTANQIWSRVKLVNESGDAKFITFDEFRKFWLIIRDKHAYDSTKVCNLFLRFLAFFCFHSAILMIGMVFVNTLVQKIQSKMVWPVKCLIKSCIQLILIKRLMSLVLVTIFTVIIKYHYLKYYQN